MIIKQGLSNLQHFQELRRFSRNKGLLSRTNKVELNPEGLIMNILLPFFDNQWIIQKNIDIYRNIR